jgi:hypothetical protein
VIIKINIRRLASLAAPSKDQAPLPVDANRAISCQLSAKLLEMVARWHAQVLIGSRVVNKLELAKNTLLKVCWDTSRSYVLDKKRPQPTIAKAGYHSLH